MAQNNYLIAVFLDANSRNELSTEENIVATLELHSDKWANIAPNLQSLLAKSEVNGFLLDRPSDLYPLEVQEILKKIGLPLFTVENGVIKKEQIESENLFSNVQRGLKRGVDIIFAVVGLLFYFFVALAIYPIVQKQSPGTLLFSQERVGKNGKRFKMYKFRSMYLGAEEQKIALMAQNEVTSEHMFKLENDPRIFPFGQKMRQWSIDELPQFINVLKGDMSLIGTRPPTVDEYIKYEFHHFKRLAIKPGITGMWQVSGRSNIIDFEEVVKLDVSYIDNWSLWLDLKILLKTIKVVLLKVGSR